jgi:hypothetical protein
LNFQDSAVGVVVGHLVQAVFQGSADLVILAQVVHQDYQDHQEYQGSVVGVVVGHLVQAVFQGSADWVILAQVALQEHLDSAGHSLEHQGLVDNKV